MTLSDYSYLKQQICVAVGKSERHAHLLDTLKGVFRGEINSSRRFEKITKINQLLVVLELRDALSEDNVRPLKQIAQMLQMPYKGELETNISQYEACHVPRESGNHYAPQTTQGTPNREPPLINLNNNPCGQMSQKKMERILQTVVEEIGKNWIDLARNLKISERKINDIDQSYKTLISKTKRLLQIYLAEKADPDRWFFELCEALDKSRRKDLKKSVTKIVTMNI